LPKNLEVKLLRNLASLGPVKDGPGLIQISVCSKNIKSKFKFKISKAKLNVKKFDCPGLLEDKIIESK
jgi:hypothetical protein